MLICRVDQLFRDDPNIPVPTRHDCITFRFVEQIQGSMGIRTSLVRRA